MLSTRYVTRAGLAIAAFVAILGLAGAARTTAAKQEKQAKTPAPSATVAPSPADYVGQERCLTCHEGKAYTGPHSLKTNERTPASTHGCESCHGPGKAHVDGAGDKTKILNPAKMAPQQASELCTACHDRGTHALWAGSPHDQRNVGCESCHSVHASKGEGLLKAATEFELCGTCHRPLVNKQYRFNHMPVREGKLACSSCHNPHGSANVKLLKAGTSVNESCTSCHAEKRGPYLWEHAPVAESCTTCHEPHGTNNERLLVSKLPFLCQRCHVTSRHPPTVYEAYALKGGSANRIAGRACVMCHNQVHGSNSPSGKAFLR